MKLKSVALFLTISISSSIALHAGNVTTSPNVFDDTTDSVTVPPNDDGTYTVTFIVTTGDDTVTASGSFQNAPSFNGAFTGSTSPLMKTVTYPTSAAGLESNDTITVTTTNGGTTCTASMWGHRSTGSRPFAAMLSALDGVSHLMQRSFYSDIGLFGSYIAATGNAAFASGKSTEIVRFKIHTLSKAKPSTLL